MTGERVDRELQQMDATIFDEFIDTMECNLYCRCGAPNDAVQKMASAILALRAQVAALAGERAEYPSDIPDVPRVIWEALNEVDPDWTGGTLEGNVRDSKHAAVAIRQLRTPTAAVIGQCRACRFAITERDGEMECERMSRVQHVGSLSNGTACATPYEGCSAVLEVTPDFGCVLWEARKDGV